MQEWRKFECTDCCNDMTEQGEHLQLRLGDVAMRRCYHCQTPTVHVLVEKQELPDEVVEEVHK